MDTTRPHDPASLDDADGRREQPATGEAGLRDLGVVDADGVKGGFLGGLITKAGGVIKSTSSPTTTTTSGG
ncbi:MAG TPA: hypothetical protein VKA84_10295 [Gemmatimonadaceae bacterium]|nr:hypothetical protein [Gemmatimonadaceae bacterium]